MAHRRAVDVVSGVVDASPATIYWALLHPEALSSWLAPQGMSARVEMLDAREDGAFRFVLTHTEPSHPAAGKTSEHADVVRGRYLALDENERVVQLVEFDSEDPAFAGEMTMTWLLVPVARGTRVTIRAENVPEGIRPEDHEEGMRSTLANLARFVEEHAPP